MSRSERRWIKPGFLANKKETNSYAQQKLLKIQENERRTRAMGIKNPISFVGSVHPKPGNDNGKRIRVEVDDGDYIPPNDEFYSDDESVGSFLQEVPEFPVVAAESPSITHLQTQHKSNPIRERVTRSTPHPDTCTQFAPCPDVDPQTETAPVTITAAPTARPTRGLTRGVRIQELLDKQGKLPVPFPGRFRAPVGKYACKLATKIGLEVRTNLTDLSVNRWKAVNESVKAPMLQRLNDQFSMEGDPTDVNKVVATQFGRRLSDYSHRLYKKYRELKMAYGEDYARGHPPFKVDHVMWTSLVDNKWTQKKFQDKSVINIANRSKMKTKHRCGSKSIPVRVHAMMENDEDHVPALKDVYKSTHYNKDTGTWISPESESNYNKIVETEAEHCSQPGVEPLSQEELSIKVLKARSGYVKGLGMRPSSSIRATVAYANNNEYVSHLESVIQEHKEEIQAQNNKITHLEGSNKQLEMATIRIMEYLRHQGNGFNEHFECTRST